MLDNNLCGDGALRALLDHRVHIGQEISVLVYDGVPSDALLPDQRIAAIEQPTAYAAGETLADMLLTVIDGGRPYPFQVLRVPVLVDGNSIGPAPR